MKDIWYENRLQSKLKEQDIDQRAELNRLEIEKGRVALLECQIGAMRNAGFSDDEIRHNISKLSEPLDRITTVMLDKRVVLLKEDAMQ